MQKFSCRPPLSHETEKQVKIQRLLSPTAIIGKHLNTVQYCHTLFPLIFLKKSLLCYHSNLYCWQSVFLSQAGLSRPNPFPPYLGVRCSHACMVHSSAPNRKDWLLAVCAKFLKFNCQSQLLKCIFIHLNRKLIRVSSHDVTAATVP